MGTELYARGVFINRCFESLNLTDPDLVGLVHAEYLRCRRRRDRDEHVRRQPDQAARVRVERQDRPPSTSKARGSPVPPRFGSSRRTPASSSSWPARSARSAFASSPGARPAWTKRRSISASRRRRSSAAASICSFSRRSATSTKSAPPSPPSAACRDLPIVAQMTTEEDGNSLDGTPPEQFAPVLLAKGANVVGVNCSVGPAPMLESIERLAAVTTARLSAMPNAGKPRDIEGRNIYLCSPEYMASYARRFISSGVRLVGGCCGTTPEHIRQIKAAARQLAPAVAHATRGSAARVVSVADAPHAQTPVARSTKSRFAAPPRRRPLCVRRRARAAARARVRVGDRQAQGAGRTATRRRHRARWAAKRRAHERAVARRADSAAGGHRDAAAVLVSRQEPARHSVGSAGRARHGAAQPPRHHRRRAHARRHSRRHRRVRRGFRRA